MTLCEVLGWTWADYRALPRLWLMDARRRLAQFALDHIGRDIEIEQAYRYLAKRAQETGADFYCPIHDCDASRCPVGAHE